MLRADLHIHTVLSPCGDVELSPAFIVRRAVEAGLDIIAVTDHNSTRQAPLTQQLGARAGLMVLSGAEITTREEVHVLALVGDEPSRLELQQFLDDNLIRVPNDPAFFGYQLVVDQNEQVVYEEESLLINAIDKSIEEISDFVRSIGGIFIPAHVDKAANSLFSQLGFVPRHLDVDALEVSAGCDVAALQEQYPYLEKYSLIRSSDAHYPDDLGGTYTLFDMNEPSFEALRRALKNSPRI